MKRENGRGAAPGMSDNILPQPLLTKPVTILEVVTIESQKLVAFGEEDGCGWGSEGELMSGFGMLFDQFHYHAL